MHVKGFLISKICILFTPLNYMHEIATTIEISREKRGVLSHSKMT